MLKLKDVVELIQSERVLVKEARAGFRMACLVVNRAGLDKADLAMTASALEALEQLVQALEMGAIGSVIHYAIGLEIGRLSLEGIPVTPQWMAAANECGFQYESPLHKALAELIPRRIEARRAATPDSERWTFAPTGDDALAAFEVAATHGANATQLVTLFRAVMPMLELATVIRGYEGELLFTRVARPLVDAGAPEGGAAVAEAPVAETPAVECETPTAECETPAAADATTPAVTDPPAETPVA